MTLAEFYKIQLERWPMAAANFSALQGVALRGMDVSAASGTPWHVTLQHNPARVRSTAAKVDAASIEARPCFLCAKNRYAEQLSLAPGDLSAELADLKYELLLNPFPIFPMHFTIPAKEHVPQIIAAEGCKRFGHMLRLAAAMPGMGLFYNGAHCGASAPDHFHFQAVEADRLPLLENPGSAPFLIFVHESDDSDEMTAWLSSVVAKLSDMKELQDAAGEPEPRMNILCRYDSGRWRTVVIPRRRHRPDFYGEGEGKFMLSPASVDLAGVIVVPSPDDFARITPEVVSDLVAQTCLPPDTLTSL